MTGMSLIKRQSGLSLVELLVAMALGLFLITGVVNVFLANKDSTQVETSLARLQENGRIAMDLLVSDIQDSNYVGCNSTQGNIVTMADDVTFDGTFGYERLSGSWSPALPSDLNSAFGGTARVGSDVIRLQQGVRLPVTSAADILTTSTGVPVASNPTCISLDDIVVIANCVTAHVFRVTNTPACDGSATSFEFDASENTPASITTAYEAGTEVMQFQEKVWYVRDTGRRRTARNLPVFALYRLEDGVENEMVEGVEYLQVLYGQETAGGNLRYVPADDASLDMAQVVSVRVALLMQSFEPVLDGPDNTAYQVLDQSIDSTGTTYTHSGDDTLRRVFQTTVMLRN
jgi:type IV pilus assembly protein PilW